MLEAGVRQVRLSRGPGDGRRILVAVACYLAAYSPTERAALQTATSAPPERLARVRNPQLIKVIRPPLHHFHAFVPMLSPSIGRADAIAFDMGKLTFNGVGMPLVRFIQQGRCRRAKSMTCRLVLGIAQSSEGGVQSAIGYRARRRTNAGKEENASGDHPQRAKQFGRLARQRHPRRPPHLHPRCWDRPNRTFEVELGPLSQPQFARTRKQKCEQL